MSAVVKFSKRSLVFCWTSLAILIILFALLVSVSRMLMPLMADYRDEIEQLASDHLGRQVRIAKITAEWRGLWPGIHLHQVQIGTGAGNNTWLQVSDAWLTVDLLALISEGRFDARRVRVDGLQLDIERREQALYVINGESFHLDRDSPDTQADLLGWVFSRDELQLNGGRFNYRDLRHSDQVIQLSGVRLSLQNETDIHHAYGAVVLSGPQRSELSFVVDMRGDMQRPLEVVNHFYVQGDVHVSAAMRDWLQPYVNIEKGAVSLKLWGQGPLQRLHTITAEMDATGLAWSIDGTTDEVMNTVERLRARAFWQRQTDGWQLDLEDFVLVKDGFEWPQSESHLIYRTDSAQQQVTLEGEIGYVRLEHVSGLLSRNLPHTLALGKELERLDVQGTVHNSRFNVRRDVNGMHDYFLETRFVDVGFERRGNLPGFRGLDGQLVMNSSEGQLRLSSDNITLDMGDLFQERISMRDLRGDINWAREAGALTIAFAGLQADNDHVQTRSTAKIRLPADDGSPFIDMSVDFRNGQAQHAPLYFPRKVMGKKALQWLDKAFVRGNVPTGKMIFHGRAADFPFVNNQGTFLVDFDVTDLQLDYGQQWPALQNVSASVRFIDNSLIVSMHDASVMGLDLLPSELKIDSLGKASVLAMDLGIVGNARHMIRYLRESPAGKDARRFLDDVAVDGAMETHLQIAIPLAHPEQYELKGSTQFRKVEFGQKQWHYRFTQLQGDLHYFREGRHLNYHSGNLSGLLMGKPVQASVDTQSGGKQAGRISISLQARLGLMQLLKDQLPQAARLFAGESDWSIQALLHEQKTSVTLESGLQGESIRLPDGFGKDSDDQRRLSIVANIDQGRMDSLSVVYGEQLRALIGLTGKNSDAGFDRGVVRFGKGGVELPRQAGLNIVGQVDSLTINEWRGLFADGESTLTSMQALSSLNGMDLSVGVLQLGRHQYHRLSVVATRRPSDLLLTLGATEFAGEAVIPLHRERLEQIDLKLKYLRLQAGKDNEPSDLLDPEILPSLQLTAETLYIGDTKLGSLVLQTERVNQGMRVSKLEIKGDQLSIEAAGSWLKQDSRHESAFNIRFTTPSIGKALKLFDFETGIDEGEAQAQLQAKWLGPPHWFEMKHLNGNLHLAILKGHLQDVDPGAGRIFGLLSIQSLQRRLFLDFSDLFKKGLSFDKIEGNFRIADGDAYTNDLYMDAPSARIDINGRIGLASEDYDEEIIVTPKLSSSIPVLGLAAGPQVALGLLLTEKILRKDINKLSQTRYLLTGSWKQPNIVKQVNRQQEGAGEP